VSVAYFDPGNFGTDIAGGGAYAYDLLWVIWLASVMGLVLQCLSGKLGIATGHSLPELVRENLK
jgi:manganese transport protein